MVKQDEGRGGSVCVLADRPALLLRTLSGAYAATPTTQGEGKARTSDNSIVSVLLPNPYQMSNHQTSNFAFTAIDFASSLFTSSVYDCHIRSFPLSRR